jgi:hypothetical protein
MTEQAPANFEAALEIASSHAYLEDRRAVHRSVAGTGVLSLDVEPPDLPAAVVARYLDIKRAGRL